MASAAGDTRRCLLSPAGPRRSGQTSRRFRPCAAEITRSALATWGLPRAAPLFEDLDLAESRQLTRTLHILHRRAAYALHLAELPQGTEELLYYFLPISLPVVAAAFISLISVYDLQRHVARYREMEHLLESSRSQTWNSLERVVQRTERALLQEVLEWNAITSFSESH